MSTLTNSLSAFFIYFLSVLYPFAFEIVFLCLSVFFSLFLFCNFSLSFLNASAFIIFLLCLYHPTLNFKCFSCLSLMPLLFKFSFCQLLSSFLSPCLIFFSCLPFTQLLFKFSVYFNQFTVYIFKFFPVCPEPCCFFNFHSRSTFIRLPIHIF